MRKKSKEEIYVELRIILNKKLYEEKIITYEVFSKMEHKLINDLNKIKKTHIC